MLPNSIQIGQIVSQDDSQREVFHLLTGLAWRDECFTNIQQLASQAQLESDQADTEDVEETISLPQKTLLSSSVIFNEDESSLYKRNAMMVNDSASNLSVYQKQQGEEKNNQALEFRLERSPKLLENRKSAPQKIKQESRLIRDVTPTSKHDETSKTIDSPVPHKVVKQVENGQRYQNAVVEGCWIPDPSRYDKLENERLDMLREAHGTGPFETEEFPHHNADNYKRGITLKHFVREVITYNEHNLRPRIRDAMNDFDVFQEPEIAQVPPEYYMNYKMKVPPPEEFAKLPVNNDKYTMRYSQNLVNAGYFEPKIVHIVGDLTVYWCSPSKVVVYERSQSSGFPYASNFFHTTILVVTQEQDKGPIDEITIDNMTVRVRGYTKLTFHTTPMGTGWIQDIIRGKTDISCNLQVKNFYEDFLLPTLVESLAVILKESSREKKKELAAASILEAASTPRLKIEPESEVVEECKESRLKFADEVTRGCWIEDPVEYTELEAERMERFLKDHRIKRLEEDCPYHHGAIHAEGIPLKFFVQNKCTYKEGNLMADSMANCYHQDIVYEPAQPKDLPDYFVDLEQEAQDADEFDSTVQLKHNSWNVKYTTIPPSPGYFEPTIMYFDSDITIFMISPRIVIYYQRTQGSGFTYSQNFHHETIVVMTQEQDKVRDGEEITMNKMSVKFEEYIRINFTHVPFGTSFIQDVVRNGTARESKESLETLNKNWFFPQLAERLQPILSAARMKKKKREKTQALKLQVKQEVVQQQEKEPESLFQNDIIKGAYIPQSEQWDQIEKERLAAFGKEKRANDWSKDFEYHKLDDVYQGITLKHIIHHKCQYGVDNMIEEIYEDGDGFDLKITPSSPHKLPEYFADYRNECPDPDDFPDLVPLKQEEYKINYKNRPKAPDVFTPKEMDFQDTITVYWISPRQFIHYGVVQGSGFTYASNFFHEGITVFTQRQANKPPGELTIDDFSIHVTNYARVNFVSCPFGTGFIQDLIKKDTDKSMTAQADQHYKQWLMPRFQDQMKEMVDKEQRQKKKQLTVKTQKLIKPKIEVLEEPSSPLCENDDKVGEIVRGCFLDDIDQYLELEKERFAKFSKERNLSDFENEFPYHKANKILHNVSLKHYVKNKCAYNSQNLSDESWENNSCENVAYNPREDSTGLPEYFADDKKVTNPDEFAKVPLTKQYKVTYVKRPPNPGVFEPKEMFFEETITIYWISPRKVILHKIVQGSGFTYAENFHHEEINVLTQEQEGNIAEMDHIMVRVQEFIRVNFTATPFGTGWIQNMINDGTDKDSKVTADRHLDGFFFPRLQESMEKVLKEAQRATDQIKASKSASRRDIQIVEASNYEEEKIDFENDLARGCYIEDIDEFSRLEDERWKTMMRELKVKNLDKDFTFKKYDRVINGVPLKLLVQHYCTYGPDSSLEDLNEQLHNYDQTYKPMIAAALPEYFAKLKTMTDQDQFARDVPTKQKEFKINFRFQHPNPGYLTPKSFDVEDTVTTYFISPRKIVKRTYSTMSGFPYAGSFAGETLKVFTQVQPKDDGTVRLGDFGVRVEHYARFHFFSTGMMYNRINNEILKEGEKDKNTTKMFAETILLPKLKQRLKEVITQDKNQIRREALMAIEIESATDSKVIRKMTNDHDCQLEQLRSEMRYQLSTMKAQHSTVSRQMCKSENQVQFLRKVVMLMVFLFIFMNFYWLRKNN